VFNAENRQDARERVGHVLERLAGAAPKVCELLEAASEDLIVFYQLALSPDPPMGRVGDRICALSGR
jgi:hypothetical protein